jgi:dTDP-glucose 4,6-dehydratase
MPRTLLLTGGLGFIGRAFARYLATHHPEYRVTVLDALTYAANQETYDGWGGPTDRYELRTGNVCDAALVDELVAAADVIVHMAAETHVTRSINDDRLFFETDVMGTQTLASAALRHHHRVERFIHISSSEVYGTALTEKMDEDHPLNPMSPYASAKCGADRLIYSYWETYRLPAVIVRPFNTFGPGQHLEKAVPRFITSCLLGEPITIHGDGSAARDWMFVDDLCRGLGRLLEVELGTVVGQAVNLGTGRHTSVLDMAKTVQQAMGTSALLPLEFLGERPGQVQRHTCDATRARELLGWQPEVSLEEGLDHTIGWYCDNERWWKPQVDMRHIPIVDVDGRAGLH